MIHTGGPIYCSMVRFINPAIRANNSGTRYRQHRLSSLLARTDGPRFGRRSSLRARVWVCVCVLYWWQRRVTDCRNKHGAPCRATPCRAMPCCAVLCCAVPRLAVWRDRNEETRQHGRVILVSPVSFVSARCRVRRSREARV